MSKNVTSTAGDTNQMEKFNKTFTPEKDVKEKFVSKSKTLDTEKLEIPLADPDNTEKLNKTFTPEKKKPENEKISIKPTCDDLLSSDVINLSPFEDQKEKTKKEVPETKPASIDHRSSDLMRFSPCVDPNENSEERDQVPEMIFRTPKSKTPMRRTPLVKTPNLPIITLERGTNSDKRRKRLGKSSTKTPAEILGIDDLMIEEKTKEILFSSSPVLQ